MKEEIWKAVPGFEGQYEVSSLGRVRSIDRYEERRHGISGGRHHYFVRGRVMSPSHINSGYLTYHLYQNKKRKSFLGHWLVALAFGLPGEGPEINHRDTDKKNNALSNLHWCTRAENIKHAKDNGLSPDNRIAVVATPLVPGIGYWFPCMAAAEEFLTGKRTGIVSWSIKTRRAYHGFQWEVV